MPLFIMLLAGAVAVIRTFLLQYSLQQKLFTVFITLLIFYGLGLTLSKVIDHFEKQNEEKRRLEEEARIAEEERLAAEEEAARLAAELEGTAENISTGPKE